MSVFFVDPYDKQDKLRTAELQRYVAAGKLLTGFWPYAIRSQYIGRVPYRKYTNHALYYFRAGIVLPDQFQNDANFFDCPHGDNGVVGVWLEWNAFLDSIIYPTDYYVPIRYSPYLAN